MTGSKKPKIGGLLLAAGGSSRLGRSKQLVHFEGQTLLRRAAESMTASIFDPVVVVLGSNSDESAVELKGLAATICLNENWRSGMSSSIGVGLAKLIRIEPEIGAVLISLCDQPFITSEMLDRFGEKFATTNAAVIAAAYNGVTGVPALFSRELFGELSRLDGDKGARDLIRSRTDIVVIDLPEASFDVDTSGDVKYLNSGRKKGWVK